MSPMRMSHPIVAAAVPVEGMAVSFEASAAEREALAAENDVESVERLTVRLDVRPHGRDGLAVRGTLEAEATRLCGVTLEPFVEHVSEEIDMRFAPERDDAGDDPPDPLIGGAVDFGAVAAEHFTLGLHPYPRKPDASFETVEIRDETASPFAALRALGLKPNDGK